jgi:hypothetical protein
MSDLLPGARDPVVPHGLDRSADRMRTDLGSALRRVVPIVFLGAIPLLTVVIAVSSYSGDSVAYDFHHELYPEAKLVVEGLDPYPPADADLSDGTNNIWPIAAVLPVVPLTLLPPAAADWVMTFLVLASLVGALWIVGARDWRVYGVTLLWPPVINAYQTANMTLPLCLLCAIAWRARRRTWLPGLVIGAAIAIKFFLWPLTLWLAATGRVRASAASVAVAGASLLLLLPFVGIGTYVELLRNLSDTFDGESYTIYALLVDVGASSAVARAATLAVGGVMLALAWRRRSFGLGIGAALVLSPIVWLHSFALLAVPMAIARPRFHPAWLLALPLWLVPGTLNGNAWQTALALVVLFAIIAACERDPSADRSRPPETVLVGRAEAV